MNKTILKATGNGQTPAKKIADGLKFEVYVVPPSVEGTPMSEAQLNQLRLGSAGSKPSKIKANKGRK